MAPMPRVGDASFEGARPTKDAEQAREMPKLCWTNAQSQQKLELRKSEAPREEDQNENFEVFLYRRIND